MKKFKQAFAIFSIFIILSCALPVQAALYSTWDVLELDSCASAWLIKRFVDTEAQFRFFPQGEFIEEGIPFDTPDADLRRKHGVSTFGSIVAHYAISDPKVKYIENLIHQIEINYWQGKRGKETEALNNKITAIIETGKNPYSILEQSFMALDELYNRLD